MTAEASPPPCIDCGRNPQPARHDGEPGTHHRCDPCAQIYLRRRRLRRRLLDGQWLYVASPVPVRCSAECGTDVEPGALFFRLGEDAVCSSCAAASGWVEAIERAVPTAPLLQSATLKRHVYDDALYVGLTLPPAMPALVASAFRLARPLAKKGIQVGIGASTTAGELGIVISGGSDGEAVKLAVTCATWLTRVASPVVVPSQMYRPIREVVYQSGGIRQARRLARPRSVNKGHR